MNRRSTVSTSVQEGARFWPLKGICHSGGHPWKDGYKVGEEIFVYPWTLSAPFAPGQHPRIGNIGWTATSEHFRFCRASALEVVKLLPAMLSDLRHCGGLAL